MSHSLNTHGQAVGSRRGLLLGIGMLGAGPARGPLRADAPARTYVYKRVADLEIRADVYNGAGDPIRPVAVWIHGGALIMGRRQNVPQRLKDQLIRAGFVVVSIDYRLAPETKLPAILEDVEGAFDWIRRRGPALFSRRSGADCGPRLLGWRLPNACHRLSRSPSACRAGVVLGLWRLDRSVVLDTEPARAPPPNCHDARGGAEPSQRTANIECRRPPRQWRSVLPALSTARKLAAGGLGLGPPGGRKEV